MLRGFVASAIAFACLSLLKASSADVVLAVQTGHNQANVAAFSPDGRLVVTAGGNAAVLWDTESGAQLRAFVGHTSYVNAANFSPDGTLVFTASSDGTLRLWNAATGAEVQRIAVPRTRIVVPGVAGQPLTGLQGKEVDGFPGVKSAVFFPDGKRILLGGYDGRARIWDLRAGHQTLEFATTRGSVYAMSATCVAYSPDAQDILTNSIDYDGAQLWNAATGKEVRRLDGSKPANSLYASGGSPGGDPVSPVAFAPQGRLLLSGAGRDKTIRIWTISDGSEIQRLPVTIYGCNSVAFSPDGKQIATAGRVTLWDSLSGKKIREFHEQGDLEPDPTGRIVGSFGPDRGTLGAESVQYSPDGSRLLVGEYQGASLWDINTGNLLRRFSSHVEQVSSLRFSPDGRRLTVNGPHIWDPVLGGVDNRFETDRERPAAPSPRGDQLAISLNDQLFLFDITTGGLLRKFEAPPVMTNPTDIFREYMDQLYKPGYSPQLAKIGSVAFSPSGKYVMTTAGPSEEDNIIRLWNVDSGKKILEFRGHQDYVVRPGAPPLPNYGIRSAVFSPDSTSVLSSGRDHLVRLWEAATGKETLVLKPHLASPRPGISELQDWDIRSDTRALDFSPDGTKLLTAGSLVQVWERRTGREILRLENRSSAAAFSPKGDLIATAGDDGRWRLWDARTGKRLIESRITTGPILTVAFSPVDPVVATGGSDGAIRIWSVSNGDPLATMVNFARGGWTVVDNSGRFDTDSLDGVAPLRWIAADQPFKALPVEIFMQQFYTPRLLPKLLKGEKLPPVPGIASTNRVQPVVGSPVVEPDPSNPDLVSIRVRVAQGRDGNQMSGLRDLRVFRDDHLVYLEAGTLAEREYVFRGIRLPRKKTIQFSAYAFNSDFVKSETQKISYERQSSALPVRRTFLLNIGIGRSRGTGCDLPYAASDAAVMGDALEQRFAAVTRKLEVSDAKRTGATRASIHAAIDEISRDATPDDTVILTFEGHGYTDRAGVFYLFPSDIDGSCGSPSDQRLLRSAISTADLVNWLAPLDAGEIVMILDACYSAASVEADGFRPGPMGNKGLGQLAYDKRMRILGASQSTQVAIEARSLQMGLLTWALVQDGLKEKRADWRPHDGTVKLREWLEYAVKRVPEVYAEHFGNRGDAPQTPALFDFAAKNDDGVALK